MDLIIVWGHFNKILINVVTVYLHSILSKKAEKVFYIKLFLSYANFGCVIQNECMKYKYGLLIFIFIALPIIIDL